MDKILREIQREDKKNPYTDQELAEMLNVARSEAVSYTHLTLPTSDLV